MSSKNVYLIGSLRNPMIPLIAKVIRDAGHDVFDDWFAAGPEADDYWRKYEQGRGHSYLEALQGLAATHVFEFDKYHLHKADVVVLALPAGKSGHLEFGMSLGRGKRGFILLEPEAKAAKLTEDWRWLCGLYEGEGSITRNGKKNGHGLQLSITMKDEDIIRRAQKIAGVGSIEGPYKRNNPKWAPMWRWATRRREDVLYTMRGLWEGLGSRRQAQAVTVLGAAGIQFDPSNREKGKAPHEYRFDVMYKFATGVYADIETLIANI